MAGIDSYVQLLLHCDGENNSTTFTDDSGTSKTVTPYGDAKISTSQSKFGGASAYFDGTGDYLGTPDHDDWNFGSGNFTIDMWVNFDTLSGNGGAYSDYVVLCSTLRLGMSSPAPAFWIMWRPSASKFEFGVWDTWYRTTLSSAQSLSTGTWYHIAMVKNGTTTTLYVDGVASGTVTGVTTVIDGGCDLTIGADYLGEARFKGYIDELRISKGVARWTDEFDPPTEAYSEEIITDIQIADVTLQTELTIPDMQVSDVCLQTEITIPDMQIADVTLQVEIDLTLTVDKHTAIIEILNYLDTVAAEATTDETFLVSTGHGLNTTDFIVNTTIRDANGMGSAERASRMVTKVSDDILSYAYDLVGQAEGDEVLLFQWLDITPYLLDKTLKVDLKASYNNSASFGLFLPVVNDVITLKPQAGQYVRITLDDEIRFYGVLADTQLKGQNEIHPYVYMNCNCISLKGLAGRRTISVDYAADTTTDEIVSDMVDQYLGQEGLKPSNVAYISTGHAIGKEWKSDIITIADVLDECAAKEGFQWFIDNDWNLNFCQDITPNTIVPLDTTSRFRGLVTRQTLDGYINKAFIIGGKDEYGDVIQTVNMSLTQQDSTQEICAGSGVYGYILRDSALSTVLTHSAEAGTSGKTINWTGHGLKVGTYIYNLTIGEAAWIVTVDDANNFTVNDTASDQTQADIIVTYPLNDAAGLNIIKRLGFKPQFVDYTIDQISINPQNRQKINLPRLGIDEAYYNIDSVTIQATGGGLFESKVNAKLSDENNFSTQHHPTYSDYMRGF